MLLFGARFLCSSIFVVPSHPPRGDYVIILPSGKLVTFFEYLEEIVLYCYKKNNNLKVF